MKRLSLCGETLRLPLLPISTGLQASLEEAMREAGLL